PSSSQQPDKRSRLLYAGCHRISKQFSFRFLSVIVRATDFDNGLDISTPHQRFTCVRLRLPYLPNYIRLFFNAHDNDSLSMPLEVVCIHLLQSECGGPTTISCEVTQTILSLRDNTVCSRHTLKTVQHAKRASCNDLLGQLCFKILFNSRPLMSDNTIQNRISNATIWHYHMTTQYSFFFSA